ncbi:hypothetical protein EF879_25055 [Micromonospora sp. HM5-17]|nr:hypothetical protein EF879_25055 [Micromonospora sp. HM5-17]
MQWLPLVETDREGLGDAVVRRGAEAGFVVRGADCGRRGAPASPGGFGLVRLGVVLPGVVGAAEGVAGSGATDGAGSGASDGAGTIACTGWSGRPGSSSTIQGTATPTAAMRTSTAATGNQRDRMPGGDDVDDEAASAPGCAGGFASASSRGPRTTRTGRSADESERSRARPPAATPAAGAADPDAEVEVDVDAEADAGSEAEVAADVGAEEGAGAARSPPEAGEVVTDVAAGAVTGFVSPAFRVGTAGDPPGFGSTPTSAAGAGAPADDPGAAAAPVSGGVCASAESATAGAATVPVSPSAAASGGVVSSSDGASRAPHPGLRQYALPLSSSVPHAPQVIATASPSGLDRLYVVIVLTSDSPIPYAGRRPVAPDAAVASPWSAGVRHDVSTSPLPCSS